MLEKFSDKRIDVLTFEKHEHKIITNHPMKEYGVGLDHMAKDDPYLACKLLFGMLMSFKHMMPDIVTATQFGGYIKSEMDGDSIARSAFMRKLEKTIGVVDTFKMEGIVIGYFTDDHRTKKPKQNRVAMPDYIIDIMAS